MTPKEKAEDLVLKYSILKDGHNHLVKQCALIAVQECIDLHYNLDGDRNGIGDSYKYWLEVKQEIEKL
jgi:hypothetical protein